MFGFVRIHKDEMKIKDYEAYKAVYCSLCKQLVRDYSFLSGFLLNYDCTFFALFSMSIEPQCVGFKKGRCRYNPIKPCNYCSGGENTLSKAAALLILMSYYKLLDNINDGGFLKRLGLTLIKPIFSLWKRKAAKKYPQYNTFCEEMYQSQLSCEQNRDTSVDEAAEPTAILLKKVFAVEAYSEHIRPAFEEFGYHLGKWVYLMDAACDIDDDIKQGSFNPIYNKLKKSKTESVEFCDGLLSQSLFLLTSAYNLIEKKRFKDILDNIILLGLTKKQKEVLFSGKEK